MIDNAVNTEVRIWCVAKGNSGDLEAQSALCAPGNALPIRL